MKPQWKIVEFVARQWKKKPKLTLPLITFILFSLAQYDVYRQVRSDNEILRTSNTQLKGLIADTERARITFELFGTGLLSQTSMPQITYELRNGGFQDGEIISTDIKFQVGLDISETPDYSDPRMGPTGNWTPGYKERETYTLREIVEQEELARLRSGEPLFFWGRIIYSSRGMRHTTAFGYRLDLTTNRNRRIPGYNFSN